jgi:putative endonuclease
MSFVYIIQNPDFRFYIGYTTDLERRVVEHQSGQGRWTKDKGPWKLVYFEEYEHDTDARKREIKLKKAKNKTYLTWLVANGPGTSLE